MSNNDQAATLQVRLAGDDDRGEIHRVHWNAFPENEREVVAALAQRLHDEATQPVTLSLVAEIDGAVCGHVVFSPVFDRDDGVFVPPYNQGRHRNTGNAR